MKKDKQMREVRVTHLFKDGTVVDDLSKYPITADMLPPVTRHLLYQIMMGAYNNQSVEGKQTP